MFCYSDFDLSSLGTQYLAAHTAWPVACSKISLIVKPRWGPSPDSMIFMYISSQCFCNSAILSSHFLQLQSHGMVLEKCGQPPELGCCRFIAKSKSSKYGWKVIFMHAHKRRNYVNKLSHTCGNFRCCLTSICLTLRFYVNFD